MEDFEKQLHLGMEAYNISKNINKYLGEWDLMRIYKAKVCCEIFLCYNPEGVENTELKESCKKYLENFDNFKNNYNYEILNDITNRRFFDLSGKRIQEVLN